VRKLNRSFKVAATCLALSLSFAGIASATSVPKDIVGHWAQKQLYNWVNQGLINGYKDGSVKPNSTITRAEFITLVNKVNHFDKQAPISFKDVKEGDWFYAELAKAKAAGYISGYEDGTIRPNADISRQEAAVILAKTANLETAKSTSVDFMDASMFESWSKNAVETIVAKGYMKGYPDKTFKPTHSITRAEAVVALANLFPGATGGINQAADAASDVTITGAGGVGPIPNKDAIIDSAGCVPNTHQFKQGGHLAFGIDIQTTKDDLRKSLKPVVQIWTTDAKPTLVKELPLVYGGHPPQLPAAQQKFFWTVGLPITPELATGDYSYKFVVNGQYEFTPDNHTFTVLGAQN
jgi:hypothetical protein